MKKNNIKKDKVLYLIIIILICLMIGMFIYFKNRLDIVQKHTESNMEMSIAIFKRLNKTIELNYLDTDNFKYLVNPNNWNELLKEETALSIDDLENFKIDKVIIKQRNDKSIDDVSEYTIIINMLGSSTFNDFTNLMYQKMNAILVETQNDTSKVESFKEGKGYYEISSFEEATYNNMYYDYMKTLSDGTTGGPKVKVKILYLEETNQIKMEINKF